MKLRVTKNFVVKSCVCSIMILWLTLSSCGLQEEAPVTVASIETTELSNVCTAADMARSDPEQKRLEARCEEIAAVYRDTYESFQQNQPIAQSGIDEIECLLIEAGYDVLDTNGDYPAYLTTADRFYDFWDSVRRGEDAEQEMIRITEAGDLSYILFTYQGGEANFFTMRYCFDGAVFYEKHQVLDWEVTDRGHFYFRIYSAGDKHYADYTLIRLTPPDQTLYDMTLRYILPIGYATTNLFLSDWSETDWGELSLNDLWDCLYYAHFGEQPISDAYVFHDEPEHYEVPAAEFESLIQSYFQISREKLRDLAFYQKEGDYYPWMPLLTNETKWSPVIEPEVTSYETNPDGMVTLTVDVLCTDQKMDCLFTHEVTIRLLEHGQFQYVGNKITYRTEYDIPTSEPRLSGAEF